MGITPIHRRTPHAESFGPDNSPATEVRLKPSFDSDINRYFPRTKSMRQEVKP